MEQPKPIDAAFLARFIAPSARRCEICGKPDKPGQRKTAITRYVGVMAHRECFEKARAAGKLPASYKAKDLGR